MCKQLELYVLTQPKQARRRAHECKAESDNEQNRKRVGSSLFLCFLQKTFAGLRGIIANCSLLLLSLCSVSFVLADLESWLLWLYLSHNTNVPFFCLKSIFPQNFLKGTVFLTPRFKWTYPIYIVTYIVWKEKKSCRSRSILRHISQLHRVFMSIRYWFAFFLGLLCSALLFFGSVPLVIYGGIVTTSFWYK